MEKHPNNPDHTVLRYAVELDLKGSIPGFVVKTAVKDQGYQIPKMKKAIVKYM